MRKGLWLSSFTRELHMLARSARLALFGAVAASMTAAATPLRPAFELEGVGLEVAAAGVGLRGAGAGQRAIRLAIGGPVEKAMLYWAGRQTSDLGESRNCQTLGVPWQSRGIAL